MAFYFRIVRVFRQVDRWRQKHCDIRPESFLYREMENAWLQNYETDDSAITMEPVISNFHKTIGWRNSCKNPANDYTDPEEFQGKINYTTEFSENVELFSVSLVILYLETNILQNLAFKIQPREALTQKLSTLPDASEVVKMFVGDSKSLSTRGLKENFAAFPQIVANWNNKNFKDYSYKKFKLDVEWLAKGMQAYYEFILNNKITDQERVKKLLKIYDQFTDDLAMMVRENSMATVWQRPGVIDTALNFRYYYKAIQKLDPEINAKARILLLV